MNLKLLASTLICFHSFTMWSTCTAPLSGIYTINAAVPASATNYTSFGDLAADFNTCGVSGNVIVNVASGMYTDSLNLSKIPGTGANSTITIQADPSNTGPVKLEYASGNFVVKLDSVSYLTIRGITLKSDQSNVIDISPGYNHHIVFEGDSIITTGNFYGIYDISGIIVDPLDYGFNDDFILKNNVFKGSGGLSAIIDGGVNIAIDSNEIINTAGLFFMSCDSISITHNYIHGHLTSGGRYIRIRGGSYISIDSNIIDIKSSEYGLDYSCGIQIYDVVGKDIKVIRNWIKLKAGNADGIILSGKGSPDNPNIIANNMISVGYYLEGGFNIQGSSNCVGIALRSSLSHTHVVFNSVNIMPPSYQGLFAAFQRHSTSADSGNYVLNNSFVNSSGKEAVQITGDSLGIDSMDFNNLYTTGPVLAMTPGGTVGNLADWQSATGFDQNSVSGDPGYISDTNLRLTTHSGTIADKGIPYGGITEDIDGESRSATTPDIGADEYDGIFGPIGSCSPFSLLTIDDVRDISVDVNWTPGVGNTSYYLEYGPKGYHYRSPAAIGSFTGTYPADTSHVIVSGLTPETDYDFYLTEYCNSSDSILLSDPTPVTTAKRCSAVDTVEFLQIFSDSVYLRVNESYGGIYQYQWGPSGFDQATETVGYGDRTSSEFDIDSLSPLTDYDLYIRTDCPFWGTEWYGPISFTTDCQGPLSSVYTLDPALPTGPGNFGNFRHLEKALNNCGVSGPVTINVAEGTYLEDMHFSDIQGTSNTHTIMIQSDPDNQDAVIIYPPGSAEYVIKLDSVSYLTFRNLTIGAEITSGINRMGVDLTGGGNHHIVFENDSIRARNTGLGAIYSDFQHMEPNEYITVKNCLLRGGKYGFRFITFNGLHEGIVIDSNKILDNFAIGIDITTARGAQITNNIIISDSSTYTGGTEGINISRSEAPVIENNVLEIVNVLTNASGIIISNCTQAKVRNNGLFVTGGTNASGMEFYSGYGAGGYYLSDSTLVANNMIRVSGGIGASDQSTGIFIRGQNGGFSNSRFVFNSILMSRGNSRFSYGLEAGFGNNAVNNTILNNSIVNRAGGYVSSYNLDSGTVVDYNNYYTNDTSKLDLPSWQATTTYDSHSISFDPDYVSSSDLHALGLGNDSKGLPLSYVTTDFDGETRSSTNPDIGADEFTPGACVSPVNLRMLEILSTSVRINWIKQAGNTTEIEFDTVGYTAGTGTISGSTTDSVYTVQGLLPNTDYCVYIRDICSNGDTTRWYGPLCFTTACRIEDDDFPYLEDFGATPNTNSEGELSNCWKAYGKDNFSWLVRSGPTPSSSTGPLYDHTYQNLYGAYAYTEYNVFPLRDAFGDTAFLESPAFNLTNLYRPSISFYYYMYGDAITRLGVEVWDTATSSWINIRSIVGEQQQSDTLEWYSDTVDVSAYSSSVTRFRLYSIRDSVFNDKGDVAIDDFLVFDDFRCSDTAELATATITIDSIHPANSSGRTINFSAAGSAGGMSYDWNFGDGTRDTGSTVSHNFTFNSSYIVSLQVNGICDTAIARDTVVIEGIGISEEILNKGLDIYPNPAKEEVIIELYIPGSSVANVRITDVSGCHVLSRQVHNINGRHVEKLDVSEWSSGMYMIHLNSEGYNIYRKLYKQ